MQRASKAPLLLCVAGLLGAIGCEEKQIAPAADASAKRPSSPPPSPLPSARSDGCARVGSIDALVRDPSCGVARVVEDPNRPAMKQLAVTVAANPPEVLAGGTSVLTVTIENTGSTEATVFFEARRSLPGPRTDWSRVAGVPVPVAPPETPRLFFPMTTTDASNRDVDALPTIANSAEKDATEPIALGVHLRPGGKLTHTMSWWAYRIPAPLPIVKDDAGRHRYVPKTTAVHLTPGEYTVAVDVPLFGLGKEERKATTRIRVTRAPLRGGGMR